MKHLPENGDLKSKNRKKKINIDIKASSDSFTGTISHSESYRTQFVDIIEWIYNSDLILLASCLNIFQSISSDFEACLMTQAQRSRQFNEQIQESAIFYCTPMILFLLVSYDFDSTEEDNEMDEMQLLCGLIMKSGAGKRPHLYCHENSFYTRNYGEND
uniref:Uncharacterized protein n=1 Tax=Onchocerca volvulus TaxID=6282 RepID=A0A8R1XKM4_ONCVO